MSYYFSTIVDCSFDEAVSRATGELQKEGFGVLSEINVQEALKKKLGVEFKKYLILGACNPPYAYQALQLEEKIGTMLPCNVIVLEKEDARIEIAAVDPMASMQAIANPGLLDIARDVQEKLQKVIAAL
jgi:uncharacterized protein (DUF302 family)